MTMIAGREILTRAQAARLQRPWRVTLYFRSGATKNYALIKADKEELWFAATHGMHEKRLVAFQTSNADTIAVSMKALAAMRLEAQRPKPQPDASVLKVKLQNFAEEIEVPIRAEEDETYFEGGAPLLISYVLKQGMISLDVDKFADIKIRGCTPSAVDTLYASDIDGGGFFLFPSTLEWMHLLGPVPENKRASQTARPPKPPISVIRPLIST